jgi:hypothetical protein
MGSNRSLSRASVCADRRRSLRDDRSGSERARRHLGLWIDSTTLAALMADVCGGLVPEFAGAAQLCEGMTSSILHQQDQLDDVTSPLVTVNLQASRQGDSPAPRTLPPQSKGHGDLQREVGFSNAFRGHDVVPGERPATRTEFDSGGFGPVGWRYTRNNANHTPKTLSRQRNPAG